MSSKRVRDSSYREAFEEYGSLLRQHCNRVMIRFDRTKRVEGIDQLVLLYALHYLNPAALQRTSIVAQAQQPLLATLGRVTHPHVFAWAPLASVLDQVADDLSDDATKSAVKDLQELADLRNELGEHMANADTGGHEDSAAGSSGAEVDEVVGTGGMWALCASYLEARLVLDVQRTSLEAFHVAEVDALIASLTNDELSEIAGDVSALLACPADRIAYDGTNGQCGRSTNRGIDVDLYSSVRATARHRYTLSQVRMFDKQYHRAAPPLTEDQQALMQRMEEAAVLAATSASLGGPIAGDMGVGLDFVPDEQYLVDTASKDNEAPLQEDENFFKDEVHDYYLRRNAGARTTHLSDKKVPQQLVKPNRYCKVKTGFNWTQYNKTHYTRSNPPPKTVMWYEFTLFYPLLLQNKKINWSRIYRIEDVEQGFNDEYCLLVFCPGPPYADVAYRVVRRQWDTRPGAVRCSYDAKGKFRLFFKFSNSNYKR
jgi:hypothetical protein